MTETDSTIAMAFVESLAPYQITLTVEDSHDICHVRERWKSCMAWIATVEQWLSLGQPFKTPPECLSRFLSDDQRNGVRESFEPPKRVAPMPLPNQKSLFD